jgi:hypothetical protein
MLGLDFPFCSRTFSSFCSLRLDRICELARGLPHMRDTYEIVILSWIKSRPAAVSFSDLYAHCGNDGMTQALIQDILRSLHLSNKIRPGATRGLIHTWEPVPENDGELDGQNNHR